MAWFCAAVLVVEGYDIAAVGYVVPLLADAWRVPPTVFTTALVSGNMGLLIGSLIAGSLGDRLGRKPVLIACVSVFGVLTLISALVSSPTQLAASRFLAGLGLGGGLPLMIALASDFAPAIKKGRFVVLASLGIPVGFVLAGLLSSQMTRAFGWQSVFLAGGVAPLFLVPQLIFWLPESILIRGAPPPPHGRVTALFKDGRTPSTALLWPINLLNLLATYFLVLWTPAILHGAGASPSAAIATATIFSLGIIVSPVLVAPVVDRFGIECVLTIVLGVGTLCILTVGMLDQSPALLAALVFGAGIGVGAQSGINALPGLIYPADIRATGAGWALGLGRLGGVAGPLLGGALLASGFNVHQMYAAAALPAFGAMLLMAVLWQVRTRTHARSSH